MSAIEKPIFNDPIHLSKYFGKSAEIVGTLAESMKQLREHHATLPQYSLALGAQQSTTNVTPDCQPVLNCTAEVKSAYQTNNWNKIKKLEQDAQKDIQPLYDLIKEKGDDAWVQVKITEVRGKMTHYYFYYAVYSNYGAVYTYCPSVQAATAKEQEDDPKCTFVGKTFYGVYSKTTNIMGIHSYNIDLPTTAVYLVLASMLAKAIIGIIRKGIAFLVSEFPAELTGAAMALGLETICFVIPVGALGTIGCCLVFVVCFIGLAELWNWLNRQYTILARVYNWSSNNDYTIVDQAVDNAVNPGKTKDQNTLNLSVNKMVKPKELVFPPGWDPMVTLDQVVFYQTIVYENDITFMHGCAFGLRIVNAKDTSQGFNYAFQCPAYANNGQHMYNGVSPPKSFLTNAEKYHMSNKTQNITSSNIPMSASMSALSGASDQTYTVNIHINHTSE